MDTFSCGAWRFNWSGLAVRAVNGDTGEVFETDYSADYAGHPMRCPSYDGYPSLLRWLAAGILSDIDPSAPYDSATERFTFTPTL